MKELYIDAEIEIIDFLNTDVIMTSDNEVDTGEDAWS